MENIGKFNYIKIKHLVHPKKNLSDIQKQDTHLKINFQCYH